MNVIYDISVLGPAHYNNRGRTGIARTIESLLDSLLSNGECDICFSAFNSLDQLVQASFYLDARPHLKKHSFCFTNSKIMNNVARVATQLYPDADTSKSSNYRRRVVSFFLKRLSHMYRSLDDDLLRNAEIFHSTFYPLPRCIHSSQKLQRFMTIYDMIPVLSPQYFEPQIIKSFNKILESLRPDDWVLAISQSTKNDLCDHLNFDPSRVFVTPLAASELFYQFNKTDKLLEVRKKYQIPDSPYVLSLCTLEPRKNIDHTIRCFVATIREQHICDLNLVLVGTKGWDFDKIFSEISDSQEIRGRIIVTGYVPDKDLAALYSGAMMFAYPSFYEGFGLPPLEAMQCGVPVITSNTSSLPEVVGDAGIMVDPTDGEGLSQAILDLYSQSSLRKNLSLKSLERAKLFSWEKCAQQTVAAYKVAMEG